MFPHFISGEIKMSTKMKIKEFEACLHLPQKLKQIIRGEKEIPQMLPPRAGRYAYPVDSYPACPDSWMNGSDIAGSYFVGVEEDKGMWLDFNPCCHLDRDVAVVVSIQGVNPITGQKTDALRLEQYKKKCPVHDVDFQQNNYCPKCDFDWPDQNYLATTGTPLGNLWLDGFRRPDGTVRQYIFTAEEMKGIASQIIGKDKVYAIGIAFYYSKEEKPKNPGWDNDKRNIISVIHEWKADNHTHYGPYGQYMYEPESSMKYSSSSKINKGVDLDYGEVTCSSLDSLEDDGFNIGGGSASMDNGIVLGGSARPSRLNKRKGMRAQTAGSDRASKNTKVSNKSKKSIQTVKPVKKLEIGAGALINQKVYRDTREIEYWEDKPASMLYINYCDIETLSKILEAGEIQKKSEGFMDGLVVGS